MKSKEVVCRYSFSLSLALFAGIVSAQGAEVAESSAPTTEAYPESIEVKSAAPEDTGTSAEGEKHSSRVVEEIIVTAQKREENLQDVPISISAFSAASLDARGIEDVTQLSQATPGLQITNAVGYPIIYIRGVGSDAFIPSVDPSVALYIDGIYIPTSHGNIQSFGGIERVEVLKGPQGTLFGRNSTGGAINIVTREPGQGPWTGSLEGGLGNFNERRTKAYVSGPLADWIGISVDGLFSEIDNAYKHESMSIPPQKTASGRAKVNIHPTDDFEVSLTYFRSDVSGPSATVAKNIHPSQLFALLGVTPEEDNRTAVYDFPAKLNGWHEAFYGSVTMKFPMFDFKAIGSKQNIIATDSQYDYDNSPLPLIGFNVERQFTDQVTGEIQLTSNNTSWGADHFEWVVGLYYLHSLGGYEPVILRAAPLVTNYLENTNPLGALLPDQLVGLLERIRNTPLSEDGLPITINGTLFTRSISGYFQSTVHFTDWLDLTLGGRYQEEYRALRKANSNLRLVNGDDLRLFSFALDDSNITNFSPKVVLTARPIDHAMIYASWSKGFKSATYNIVNIYQAPDYVKPEEVTNVELGVKADFAGGNVRLNTAVFETKIKNLQSQFISLLAGGAVNVENAGAGRIRGAEIDLTWVPMDDLNPGLAVTANGTYLDAIYTSFKNGSGFDPSTGLFNDNLDFTGNRIVRTPKFAGGLGALQTLDVGDTGEVEIGADVYYNSGFYYTAQNVSFVREGAYTTLNARISYLYRPWNLRGTLFGENLTNEDYHVQQFQTDVGNSATLAYPLRWGAKLAWEF